MRLPTLPESPVRAIVATMALAAILVWILIAPSVHSLFEVEAVQARSLGRSEFLVAHAKMELVRTLSLHHWIRIGAHSDAIAIGTTILIWVACLVGLARVFLCWCGWALALVDHAIGFREGEARVASNPDS